MEHDGTRVKQEFYLLRALETAKKDWISREIFHAEKCTQGPSESEGGSNDTDIPLCALPRQ